jgi:hypothetical protein
VGLLLIYLAFWKDPSWATRVAGPVVVPALTGEVLAIRARRSPEPLIATGPVAHVANAAVILAFVLNPRRSARRASSTAPRCRSDLSALDRFSCGRTRGGSPISVST